MAKHEIRVYGVVGDWFDELDAKSFAKKLDAVGAADEIVLRINSPGGYVDEGLAIFNLLKAHAAKKTAIVDGVAASMASVIAMAGDQIVMPATALMMIHDPSGIVLGTADDMRKTADVLDKMAGILARAYADRTGLGEDEIRDLMTAETWMTGEEAARLGFATQVAGEVKDGAMDRAAARMGQILALKNTPDALRSRVQSSTAHLPSIRMAASAVVKPQESSMPENGSAATATAATNPPVQPVVDAAAIRQEAAVAERRRGQELRNLAKKAKLDPTVAEEWINEGLTLEQARAKAIDLWAAQDVQDEIQTTRTARVTSSGPDERQKFAAGVGAWLANKAGVTGLLTQHAKASGGAVETDPGEFRGYSLVELARASLERSGVRTAGMDKLKLVATAMMSTTSDFPILLESTINKILLAAYATQPDTWSRFCRVGSVGDFRASNRYRIGSFGTLDRKTEAAEFLNKAIPDGEKQSISIGTRGNIISITREAIINDDMDAFSSLATMFGRAARLSIEVDVYALFALNSANGPTMADTNPLFHASHANIAGASAAPSVAAFDAARVQLASQKDVSGNEFLDLRPAIWLGPIGLGGTVRVVNDAVYDVDSTKFQVPNKVRGLIRDIIDTPRLTGTAWYMLADPSIAPSFEVAFLDGNQEPFLDSEEGFRVDGVSWKVRLDYGVAAIDWRPIVKNAGA